MTYYELCQELGFVGDWEGFAIWADLPRHISSDDPVPADDAAFMREAMRRQALHAMPEWS